MKLGAHFLPEDLPVFLESVREADCLRNALMEQQHPRPALLPCLSHKEFRDAVAFVDAIQEILTTGSGRDVGARQLTEIVTSSLKLLSPAGVDA